MTVEGQEQLSDFMIEIERQKLDIEKQKLALERDRFNADKHRNLYTFLSVAVPILILAATIAFNVYSLKVNAEHQN